MRTGDERYLPARDRGPVKRFIRNFVDSRLTVVEFLLPVLLVIWVMQASGNSAFVRVSTALWTTTILVIAVDTIWLMIRIRRAIRRELPEESLKGTTTYTLMRVVQIRPLRQPKPQVRVGGRPK
jgi:membrane protein implicated in regulation of membrane protease activity